jgi:hypothetical protein
MTILEAMQNNLLTPMPLFFALGLLAKLIGSDLKIPDAIYTALVLYLLTAIGFRGGAEIHEVGIGTIWAALLAAAFLGVLIPCIGFVVLRHVGRFSIHDAAAVAGHYGSVSAVTFAAASQFPHLLKHPSRALHVGVSRDHGTHRHRRCDFFGPSGLTSGISGRHTLAQAGAS